MATYRRVRGAHLKTQESIVSDAVARLDQARKPLFRAMRRIPPREQAGPEGKPHACCLRERNEMRISTLEAAAIVRALDGHPALRLHRNAVVERARAEAATLTDSEERQRFTCPLLDGEKCLVHRIAKPIGCLAWNEGREYTRAAWLAFQRRDVLNERAIGEDWELKAIPIQLVKQLGE